MNRFLAIILFAYSAQSLGQSNCNFLFTFRPVNTSYQTLYTKDLRGEPLRLTIEAGPLNVNTELTDFPFGIDTRDINATNESLARRERVQVVKNGGYPGIGTREQWLSFLAIEFPKILKGILNYHDKNISDEARKFIEALLQLHPDGIKLQFSDNSREFDLPSGKQRIAKTDGHIGSPVIINAKLLLTPKIFDKDLREDIKGPRGFDYDHVAPFSFSFENAKDLQDHFGEQSDLEKLRALFSILVHEAGHFLHIPDSPQNPLDQLAGTLSKLFSEQIEEISPNLKNHPWIKFINLNLNRDHSGSRLLLLETGNAFDVTDAVLKKVRSETDIKFSGYTFLNLRWESEHTRDLFHYTTPHVLAFDVLVETPKGKFLIPLRLSNYFAANVVGQVSRDLPPDKPWENGLVQLKIGSHFLWSELQILKSKIRTSEEGQNSFVTDQILNQERSLTAGSMWRSSVVVTSEKAPRSAKVYFSKKSGVNSGLIKRAKVAFTQTRIEPFGVNQFFLHSEFLIPLKFQKGEYYISRVELEYEDKKVVDYEPNSIENVSINGEPSLATLTYAGYSGVVMESPKKPGYRPRVMVKAEGVKNIPYGGIIPLVFNMEGVARPQRISLHGYVDFKDNKMKVGGLHVDVLAKDSPMVQRYSFEQRGNVSQLIVYFRIPKFINNQKVEAFYIDSIYLQDENMAELFDPSPIAIGVDVDNP